MELVKVAIFWFICVFSGFFILFNYINEEDVEIDYKGLFYEAIHGKD